MGGHEADADINNTMLYLIYGTDRQRVLARSQELVASLQKRKPDAEVFRLSEEEAGLARLQELSAGQGLFEGKFIVVLRNAFGKKDVADSILENLAEFQASPNIFVFVEGPMLKSALAEFKKSGAETEEHAAPAKEREEFNMFALANALRDRDRRKLWVLYQKALRADAAPEAVSGMLFWQVKDMLLKRSSKFSEAELHSLASTLITLYHDAHRGSGELEISLERFILSV